MVGRKREMGRPVVVLEQNLRAEIWQELFRMGRQRNWRLLDLHFSGNSVPRGLRPLGAFVNRLPDDTFARRLLAAGCHVVRLGLAPHRNDHLVPAVLPDLKRTGELAAEHFAERGFRRLAFVAHKPWGIYEPLYKGFQIRGTELGCECHEFHWASVDTREKILAEKIRYRIRFKAFKSWLAAVPKPVGLLGFNDVRAGLYSRMCMDAGFSVPDTIGILGVGNDETICETIYPSMSSIILDDETVAQKAVDILELMLSGKTPEETTVFVPPVGLVTRQSTDVFAAETPGVAKATRFMLDHFAEPIRIEAIAHASGMSRARLFVAFKKEFNQAPGAILTRIRIDKAKQMLRDTSDKVLAISEACGFGASINMYHHFKRQLGVSPAYYRKTSEQQYRPDK